MKILVTGGLGAVGTPLVKELIKRGNEVWISDRPHSSKLNYLRCDFGYFRQVNSIFENHKFDYVYHLAAEFGRWNGEDFYETLWNSNAIGTKNIIKCQEKYNFKLIFFSSSEVYGDWDGVMSENVVMENSIRQLNDYAISKWVGEQQVMNSADRYGTESVRIRLFNTYGPGEYFSDYRSVICKFIYHALRNKPYTVYLNHHRSSTYITDTVNTLANIVDNFIPGEVYNVSGDEYHDIKTLSDMILSYLGKDDSLVKYVDEERLNTRDKKSDNSKAKKDLKHQSKVKLKDGIPLTVEWQKEVYNIDK